MRRVWWLSVLLAVGCVRSPCPDGGDFTVFYRDRDGDGYGTNVPVPRCFQPDDHVLIPGDCADRNADINPDGVEGCNGLDDDCDPETPELGFVFLDDERLTPEQAADRLEAGAEVQEIAVCGATFDTTTLGDHPGSLVIRGRSAEAPAVLLGRDATGSAAAVELRELTIEGQVQLVSTDTVVEAIALGSDETSATVGVSGGQVAAAGLAGRGWFVVEDATTVGVSMSSWQGVLDVRANDMVTLNGVSLAAPEGDEDQRVLRIRPTESSAVSWILTDVSATDGLVDLYGAGTWQNGANSGATLQLRPDGDIAFIDVTWTGSAPGTFHWLRPDTTEAVDVSGLDMNLDAGGVLAILTNAPLTLTAAEIINGDGGIQLQGDGSLTLAGGELSGHETAPALSTFRVPVVLDGTAVRDNSVDVTRYAAVLELGVADATFSEVTFADNAPAAVSHRGAVWDVQGLITGACDAGGCR